MPDRQPRPLPSIWATGQSKPHRQRSSAYVAGNVHPAKMWPHIAATAIARYSAPGDTVLDPMCGVGTSLIEAIQLGRNAYGVDLEPEWVDLARANVDAAMRAHPGSWGEVFQGDAANLAWFLESGQLRTPVDMVLTSPPYGAVTHGQPDTSRVTGGEDPQPRPSLRHWQAQTGVAGDLLDVPAPGRSRGRLRGLPACAETGRVHGRDGSPLH